MKRIISVLLVLIMAAGLCVSAFAANETAGFLVNILSESDTEAMVSIDYNGGQSFNSLDFEVKLSERVALKSCANGAGLRNFKIYVSDLESGDLTLSSFNKDNNPIKFTFATTLMFKAVNGKDLLTLTITKKSAAKLTADDVMLTVTNCGVSEADGSTANVKTSVIQIGNVQSGETLQSPNQIGTAAEKTGTPVPVSGVTSVSQESATGESELSQSEESVELITDEGENSIEQSKTSDKRKIIIVAAAAFCLVIVIAATVIYITKKSKKED